LHLGKRNLFKGTKNIYIADIHSDGLKLEALIKNLKKECSFVDYRIVFLGDLFGKIGMNTIKVLEVVKELKKTNEVLLIKGNWESYIIPELKDMDGCDLSIQEHIDRKSGFNFLKEFQTIGLKTGDDLYHYLDKNKFFEVFKDFIPYFETKKVLATHAPLSSNLFYMFYNKHEDNKGILEKFPIGTLDENFTNEDIDKININKILVCGHQTGVMVGPWGNQKLIEREYPTVYDNRIYLDSGGAGTGKDISIFAWVEDIDIFVKS